MPRIPTWQIVVADRIGAQTWMVLSAIPIAKQCGKLLRDTRVCRHLQELVARVDSVKPVINQPTICVESVFASLISQVGRGLNIFPCVFEGKEEVIAE